MNINLFEAKMVEHKQTNFSMSKSLGMSEPTFVSRKRTGDFKRSEIETIAELLDLNMYMVIRIFFPNSFMKT